MGIFALHWEQMRTKLCSISWLPRNMVQEKLKNREKYHVSQNHYASFRFCQSHSRLCYSNKLRTQNSISRNNWIRCLLNSRQHRIQMRILYRRFYHSINTNDIARNIIINTLAGKKTSIKAIQINEEKNIFSSLDQ